jgi:hypothetical protein
VIDPHAVRLRDRRHAAQIGDLTRLAPLERTRERVVTTTMRRDHERID